jgi:acid stress chaperone HdeB
MLNAASSAAFVAADRVTTPAGRSDFEVVGIRGCVFAITLHLLNAKHIMLPRGRFVIMAGSDIISGKDGTSKRRLTMATGCVSRAFVLALCTVSTAQAQVTIDMTKVTCEQFVQYRITNDESVAIWLSGYLNGKRGNTAVDPQKLKGDASKVRKYCIMNSEMMLMQAVGSVLGTGE